MFSSWWLRDGVHAFDLVDESRNVSSSCISFWNTLTLAGTENWLSSISDTAGLLGSGIRNAGEPESRGHATLTWNSHETQGGALEVQDVSSLTHLSGWGCEMISRHDQFARSRSFGTALTWRLNSMA